MVADDAARQAGQDRLKGAADYYARALKIEPQNEEAWFGRGSVLCEVGEHEAAISCLDHALGCSPDNERALYNKAVSLAMLEKPQQSLECLAKALELDPSYVNAWFLKAAQERMLGHSKSAITSCEVFLRLTERCDHEHRQTIADWLSEIKRAC